jgi:hypothetical protein
MSAKRKTAAKAPESEPGFSIDGTFYPAASSFTLGEARTLKRVGGVMLDELEAALEAGDPDALVAVVLITMQRVDPSVTVEQVEALDVSVLGGASEEAPADPPAEAGA